MALLQREAETETTEEPPVSCASTSFCVAVDRHRHAFVSTNPTGGVSAWQKISGIDGELTSIACATTSLCVAVDGQGNEVTASS